MHAYGDCPVDHFGGVTTLSILLLFLPRFYIYGRFLTSPFRKACDISGAPPHKDGKRPQQPNSGMMVQHVVVDAERSGLHGEVMACAYEDVQVMWNMLDKARILGSDGS